MLKWLAIVGLFGALASVGLLARQTAPLGSPKQGITKPDSGKDGKDKAQPQGSQQTTPNAVPTTVQPTTPTCDDACQQGRQNLAIQGKLEWFTGVLAIVGVLQVATMVWQAELLRGTLTQIQAQAGHLERQNRNAINSERARLVVRIVPDKLHIADMNWKVTFQIDNIGRSHAFNIWTWANFEYIPSFVPPPIPRLNGIKHISRIRTERGRNVTTIPRYEDSEGNFVLWNEQRMKDMSTGKIFLHLRGAIEYEDIFGGRHLTPFRYLWNADYHPNSSWGEEPDPKWMAAVNSNDPSET